MSTNPHTRKFKVGLNLRWTVVFGATSAAALVLSIIMRSAALLGVAQAAATVAIVFVAFTARALWIRIGRVEQKLQRIDNALEQSTTQERERRQTGERAARERADVQTNTIVALLAAHRDLAEKVTDVTALVVAEASGFASSHEPSELKARVTRRARDAENGQFLSAAHALSVIPLLLESEDVLTADELVTSHKILEALPLRLQRQLGRRLRERGYLLRAIRYFTAAGESQDPRDANDLRLRLSEIQVMSGAFTPTVPANPVTGVAGRVLHVVGKTAPLTQSGYTIRTHYTALAQARIGLDPHIVSQTGTTSNETALIEVIDGISYHRTVGPIAARVGMAEWLQHNTTELARVVQEVRPALLHAHSDFLNALSAQAVGDATGIPVLYESRGFWEESWLSRTVDKFGWPDIAVVADSYGMPEAYQWRRDREAGARSGAAHVVTLASMMAERIYAAGLSPDRVTLAPNAVDPDAFPVSTRDLALAETIGLRPDELVIGYISSIVEYEGIDTLVDAFGKLRARTDVPVRLLVVGGGPVLGALKAQAAALGLTNVTFTGRVPHDVITSYYSLIDIFVVPRRPTDVSHLVTPLKPFEAFSTGRTVVLSDVSALREIADDSNAAALFRAGDSDSLANVLEGLVLDPAERARLAALGAHWVRSERTWDTNAQTYLLAYRGLGVERGEWPAHEQR